MLERDDAAGVADDSRQPWATPASTLTRALTIGRQDGVAVGLRPARRTTRGTASRRRGRGCPSRPSCSRACDGELHLGAGADQDHVGRAAARRRAGRSRRGRRPRWSRSRRSPRGKVGTFCRVSARPAGPVGVLEDRLPGGHGLVGVRRADDVQAGDRAQRGEVLDRLVGRAVLAEADRVVGPHVGDRQLHQRRQPDRGAHVVGEDQERAAVDAGAAVQRDAVHDRAHARARGCRSAASGRTGRRGSPWWTCSAGRNDGSPFGRGVVATRPGRPSRPTARAAPGASAVSTSPDALRVATPFGVGVERRQRSSQPPGRLRVRIRSSSALRCR